MLHMHIAFALQLLVLVAGTWLFIWSKHSAEGCSWLGKIVGFIVMILGLIMTICSIVCAINLWYHGGHGRMMMSAEQTMSMSAAGTMSAGSPSTTTVHHK